MLSKARENILYTYKVNIPNVAYPNQNINTKIPHGSRDYVIVPDTVKTMFNFDIESIEKTHSTVNNIFRALLKKDSNSWIKGY